jgi:hypothetical protein
MDRLYKERPEGLEYQQRAIFGQQPVKVSYIIIPSYNLYFSLPQLPWG